MVLYNSYDSTNTLVSLEQDHKQQQQQQFQQVEFVHTELLVEDSSAQCYDEEEEVQHQPLYLPKDGNAIEDYLPAALGESCDELLAQDVVHYTKCSSRERLLYVQQGERASATFQDCDVILSDKATTCHILALHSRNLTSLTHLDGTSYEACVREMVQEHMEHGDTSIDVHILGGFNDADGTSSSITNWLLGLLADIAEDLPCKLLLKTCAVSGRNDSGYASPMGRGLGICTKTGQVFLAKCDKEVAGPAPVLRSIRLWAGSSPKRLSVVHSTSSKHLTVTPFLFSNFEETQFLLSLRDDVLLQYTSTSPDVEEDDFCHSIRASLLFLQQQCCLKIFGANLDQPLVYERVGRTNEWKAVAF